MNLPPLEELAKVIDLCQKKGVKTFQLGDLRLELGDPPPPRARNARAKAKDPHQDLFDAMPTDEQMQYYSATPPAAQDEELHNQPEIGEGVDR